MCSLDFGHTHIDVRPRLFSRTEGGLEEGSQTLACDYQVCSERGLSEQPATAAYRVTVCTRDESSERRLVHYGGELWDPRPRLGSSAFESEVVALVTSVNATHDLLAPGSMSNTF